MNPFFWVAAALAAWVAWRLLRRAVARGQVNLRGRRGTASAFGPLGVAIQQFYNPGVKHVLEQQLEAESQREDQDEGDPPEPGGEPPGR
jgi:hypothetical protein